MNAAQIQFAAAHDGPPDERYFATLEALGDELQLDDGDEHHVDDGAEVPEPTPLRLVNAPTDLRATVQPPALGTTLDELHAWLTKYIYFAKPEQPDAATLWIAYTHWFAQKQPVQLRALPAGHERGAAVRQVDPARNGLDCL